MNRRNFLQAIGASCLVALAPITALARGFHSSITIEALREEIQDSLLKFIFEPNDQMTRGAVANDIRVLLARHDVYDYSVICDEQNNTPERIDQCELHADVAIKLSENDNFVYMPVRLHNAQVVRT